MLSYKCECLSGWDGNDCQYVKDDCKKNPCKNDGECVDTGANSYHCDCSRGWCGKHCDIQCYFCKLWKSYREHSLEFRIYVYSSLI